MKDYTKKQKDLNDEHLKNQPDNNVKNIIMALIFAILLWGIVTYVNNPELSTTLTDVPVRFTGTETLKSKGFAATGKSAIPALSVKISGKRSDLIEYMSSVYVEVDVSKFTDAGVKSADATTSLPTTKIRVEKENYSEIPIIIEPIIEKEIPIRIKHTGVKKTLLIKSEIPVSEKVIVSGAKSEVDQVSYGLATLDSTNKTEDYHTTSAYVLIDTSDTPITNNETIECNRADVNISNTVYQVKSLPVQVQLSDELNQSYFLDASKLTITPSTLDIGVKNDTIDHVTVTIKNKDSLAAAQEYLIDNNALIYSDKDVHCTISGKDALKKKIQHTITVPVSLKNLRADLKASAIPDISIQVNSVAQTISANDIQAFVDLSNITSHGNYSLPLKIDADGIELAQNYTIAITIE